MERGMKELGSLNKNGKLEKKGEGMGGHVSWSTWGWEGRVTHKQEGVGLSVYEEAKKGS